MILYPHILFGSLALLADLLWYIPLFFICVALHGLEPGVLPFLALIFHLP